MGLPDSIVILFLNFWGTYIFFYNGCTTSHSHQQCTKVLISPHILADTCYFVNDHLQGCDVVLHLVLICICFVVLSIFSSSWRTVYLSLLPIVKIVMLFGCRNSLYILDIVPFNRDMIYRYFIPLYRLPFPFYWLFSLMSRSFKIWYCYSPVYFFLWLSVLWCLI